MIRRGALLLVLVACCTGACTSASESWRRKADAFERGGQRAAALDAAEHAVAADPADPRARLTLARLAAAAGQPGQALRQYEAALSLGESSARAPLAALYEARGRARAALGQRGRWRDLERAVALDDSRRDALAAERRAARLDAGLALWAHDDLPGARALWASSPGPHPSAVERVFEDPERAPLVLVGAIALRAYQVAGARAARPLVDAYERRHGADSRVNEAARAVHRQLDLDAPPPPWRASADESAGAALDAALAWRGTAILDAGTVADVVALATRAWLSGERDAPVDEALVAFVTLQLGRARLAEVPRWARATVARILGDERAAHEAHAAGPGDFPAEAAALVALEWPESHGTPPGDASDSSTRARWLAAATIAHRAGDGAAEAHALAVLAADAGAWTALAQRGDVPALTWRRGVAASRFAAGEARAAAELALRRWRGFVDTLAGGNGATIVAHAAFVGDSFDAAAYGGAGAPDATAAPGATSLAPPHGCDDSPGARTALAQVAESFRHDPAEGARRARAFVDGAIVPGCRGLPVLALYLDAGDPARARALADELLAVEPGDPDVLALAVAAATVQKDAPAARLYLEQAEYWSVARGTPSLAASARFVAEALPVEAIAAARQALALADGTTRFVAYETLCVASLAAGRDGDAARALDAYLAELPAPRRDDARRRVAARAAAAGLDPARLGSFPAYTPGPDDPAFYLGRATAEALDAGLRRLPWALPLIVARARLEPTPTPARLAAEARLVLLGLSSASAPRRRLALRAFADLADQDGHPALAARARAAAP